jgi:ABC-type lipoprotein export system ATPase subunit/ABC-type lipoprotein release transport system permease subunit
MKRYLVLSWKNLRRRPVRTGLTVAGVGLAVTVAVSLGGFMLGYSGAIDKSINMLGFQVMIMSKGCPYEAATMMLKGGTGLLYLPADTYDKVRHDPDIESITPIFVGVAQKQGSSIRDDAGGSNFTVISGIEVASYRTMKPWVAFKKGAGYDGGRWFNASARDEVVLGFEAAEYEQRKIGDTFYASITPAGSPSAVLHEFKVVGVLDRTGTQDDGTVFLPIDVAREYFGRPDQLTILGIKLKQFNAFKMREFETRWLKLPEVQVVGLQQVKNTLVSLVGTAQTMIAAVAAIAIIVALIGVINTILMSVYERTSEIGIMKALGARRGAIFQLIWLETVMICLAGGVVGSIVAIVGSGVVEKAIKAIADLGVSGSVVQITPEVIAYAVAGAIILGFFSGLYPAWRASSMRPVEAICGAGTPARRAGTGAGVGREHAESPHLIQASALTRYYQRGSETVKALDGVDLTIRSGEMVSILGPSGSGKTTLINLLSCLDAPTDGSLIVAGREVARLPEDDLVEVRRGVLGFVFQQFALLPTLTVTENVELPLMFLDRPVDPRRTREVLETVGLADRADHLPRELSGGQMQRVAIARALIAGPKILVADEPTGNLDSVTGQAIIDLFQRLAREQGLAIILTTHNTAFGHMADRVITLRDGRILTNADLRLPAPALVG